jgi:hypothetical protein
MVQQVDRLLQSTYDEGSSARELEIIREWQHRVAEHWHSHFHTEHMVDFAENPFTENPNACLLGDATFVLLGTEFEIGWTVVGRGEWSKYTESR